MDIQTWNVELIRVLKQLGFDVLGFGALYFFVVLFTLRKPVIGRIAPAVVVFAIMSLCLSPVANWIAAPLTNRNHLSQNDFNKCLSHSPIVVILGGGKHNNSVLGTASEMRLVQAVEFAKYAASQNQNHLYVVASGGTTDSRFTVSEAKLMQSFLEKERLNSIKKIVTESASTNTYQNAVLTKKLLSDDNQSLKVTIITGAVHMPRALATFQKQGFEVCPLAAPADELISHGWGSFAAGKNTVGVINEYIGLIGYKWKDWI